MLQNGHTSYWYRVTFEKGSDAMGTASLARAGAPATPAATALVAIAHDATARDAQKEGARGASAARARATALVANPEDAVA